MPLDASRQWKLFMVDVRAFQGRVLSTSGPYSQTHAQRVADGIGVTDEAYPDIRRASDAEIAAATAQAVAQMDRVD